MVPDEPRGAQTGRSVLAVLGSARGDSHTRMLAEAAFAGRPVSWIDLATLDIQQYAYGEPMDRDDFARIAEAMVAHDTIVFVTPVYWYAMSGRMKVLFDRFTDLVTVRKDMGRRLEGRGVFLLACGADARLPEGFEIPFRETAAYLDMTYHGAFYAPTRATTLSSADLEDAAVFGNGIFATAPRTGL